MKLLTLIFVLFCGLPAFSQTPQQSAKNIKDLKLQAKKLKNGSGYEIVYNKLFDKTYVRFSGFQIVGFGESLNLQARDTRENLKTPVLPFAKLGACFKFKGDTMKESVTDYYISLFNIRFNVLLVGNEKMFVFTKDAAGNEEMLKFEGGEGECGATDFKGTKEQLLKLSQSKSVKIKVGTITETLNAEHLQVFGDIVKLGDLSQK